MKKKTIEKNADVASANDEVGHVKAVSKKCREYAFGRKWGIL